MPIATSSTPFDSAYAISSAVSKLVTLGDLCDLQRSRGHFSLLQPPYNSGSTAPIATGLTPFDSAYAISSEILNLVTLGDLCDLQRSKGHFSLWQPSYNSASTEPIETSLASFDSAYAISSAVSKLVTLGDLCDLQGSKGHFCLWQPSYNSASTEPIATSLTSFDSAYAISSAVSKLGTVGDLCDLQGSKGHFCLWQPSYNSASTEPIEMSLASFDSAYAISSAVSKLVTLGDLCDLQGSKGHFCLWQPSYNSASTEPIEMSLTSFDSAYAISSAVSKLGTVGDLCDLQGSKGHFCLWQPSYNSASTEPIETSLTSFDSAYAISSAVSKLVTVGDLCDLQGSKGHFCLWQPSYNSASTELIEMSLTSFDSAYAISSAVSKLGTVGDLCDLQGSKGHFCLWQPSYNSASTEPIETSLTSFDSAYAISSAVSKLVTVGDLCDLQGSKGHFCLWQPSYNSAFTEPIETSLASFDSAYAISLAVSKLVTLGDLCDLQGSKGHFCLWQPSYNSASTELIEMSLVSFDSAYAISSAISKLVTLGDLCDLQGSKGHFCLWQPSYNSASTEPIEMSLASFDSAYAISSAVSKLGTVGDLCDLQGSKGHFCLWQPSYNSASTEPIETSLTSFDSAYATSSAVSKLVTVGDLCDLQGSKGHFCLWQPSYNSASTEPIETSLGSFDSAYAISSAVSKLVALGDLCDLQGSKGHFCLWQPSYNSASTEPIEMSLTSFDSAYAISSAVSKLGTLGDLCDLQGSKGHFCLWQLLCSAHLCEGADLYWCRSIYGAAT